MKTGISTSDLDAGSRHYLSEGAWRYELGSTVSIRSRLRKPRETWNQGVWPRCPNTDG